MILAEELLAQRERAAVQGLGFLQLALLAIDDAELVLRGCEVDVQL